MDDYSPVAFFSVPYVSMRRLLSVLAVTSALSAPSVAVAASALEATELLDLSLEQLSNISVTSVSKRSEKANEAAAALYVITQDDIRRSGATAIPEVLRMVPGLNVAQSGSHQWAISARGFNDQFANKLLVLIDGRSVYTPIYSGVYWDVQDTNISDIERIEVIRGPGATLWGANAVNGVINIITKKAGDTQGGYAALSAGSLTRADTTVRYGTKLAENADIRVYAKYNENDEFRTATNVGSGDEWNKMQTGFRTDWESSNGQSYTLQGDIYRGGENYTLSLPLSASATGLREHVYGGNVLARVTHKMSDASEASLQMYYDNAQRRVSIGDSDVDTFDVDAQHVWTPIAGHDVVWGAGYRLVKSKVVSAPYITFTPQSSSDGLFSAFVQDKMALHADDVFLTLGSKFEHNDYTGFEYQPSARLSWLINNTQTAWASVSRAVRTPNIANSNVQVLVTPVALGPTVFLAQTNDNALNSEDLIAYEAGYRIQPAKNVSLDAAVYYNDYKDLLLGQLGPITGPFADPTLGAYFAQTVLPVNTGSAYAWGGELSAKWNPIEKIELAVGYTLQKLKFEQADPYGFSFIGKSPQQQFNARSTIFLPHDLEWNNAFYYNDALKALDTLSAQPTPSYTRLDTRLAWKATQGMEIALVGQNLLDARHKEFAGFIYQNTSVIPRSYYINAAVRF